jgi:bifunctional N-acetylglucosamine-1-phosphate-uridyltransferase/glucosamine-1-phosphate-acetyltransferase GlmU-like protein
MHAGENPMTDALHVVILAAGEGKRMNSAKPKVLLPVGGAGRCSRTSSSARARWAPRRIHVVHGHRGEAVRAAFAATPTCAGSSRRSSWAPATPCSRRCPASRTARACWCCTATCR